jgi:hypothetical protein
MSTRSSVSGDGTGPIYFRLNGDTASNYSTTTLSGNGSSASSSRQSYSYGQAGQTDYNLWTSNTFANTELYFPNYTVSQNKPISVYAVAENNNTQAAIDAQAVLWRNTAAITSIELSQVTFAIGSSFYLYGIKNS